MRSPKTLRPALVLAAAACLCAGWTGAAEPVSGSLKNGLRYVLVEDHANPLVASFFVVKIGVRGETEASCGISHLLEHLAFNGTERFDQKRLYEELDLLGAYHNAFTENDYTCYIMLTEKSRYPEALEIQADMLFRSVIPPDKLEKERGIILEELAKEKTSPEFQADRALAGRVFRGTPYALPTLGTEKSIGAMTRELVWDYYKRYYTPDNVVALVVGDFRPEEMRGLLEKRLSGFASKRGAEAFEPVDLFKGSAVESYTADIPTSRVVVTFRAPSMDAPEWRAFEAAMRWLEDPDASPIGAVVRGSGWKTFGGAYLANRDYSLYELTVDTGEAAPVQVEKAEAMVKGIRALSPGKPSDAWLAACKVRLETEEIYAMENVHYLGMRKGRVLSDLPFDKAVAFFGDDVARGIRAVTSDGVRDAMGRMLSGPQPILTVLQSSGKPAKRPGMPGMPGMPPMPGGMPGGTPKTTGGK